MNHLKNISEIDLANLLASQGEEMNTDLYIDYVGLFKEYSEYDPFLLAVANSLAWSGHANDQGFDYYENCLDYLSSGEVELLDEMEEYSGKYGWDCLREILVSWHTIIRQMKSIDVAHCPAADLKAYQQDECLTVTHHLINNGDISGIGPWLFCSPFKILAIYRNDLWKDPVLNEVWMPLGLEVNRGIKKLIDSKSSFTRDIDRNMFTDHQTGLEDGLAAVFLVQNCSKLIAQLSNSCVLHINSGLFKLGAGNLMEK